MKAGSNDFLDDFYEEVFTYIEKNLNKNLVEAKQEYAKRVNAFNEIDEMNFEGQLSSFNDWFLFDYNINNQNVFSSVQSSLSESKKEQFQESSLNIAKHYRSIFSVSRVTKSPIILRNLYTGAKLKLSVGHPPISYIKDDLFIGRIIESTQGTFLLRGTIGVPEGVLKILLKKMKLIKKQKVDQTISEFLEEVETKVLEARKYPHVNPVTFFNR
jgi:hypothetical protein